MATVQPTTTAAVAAVVQARPSAAVAAPPVAVRADGAKAEDTRVELRTLMRQQEELLAAVNGLRKAVETGMRTLNARVRNVEETVRDLIEAMEGDDDDDDDDE